MQSAAKAKVSALHVTREPGNLIVGEGELVEIAQQTDERDNQCR